MSGGWHSGLAAVVLAGCSVAPDGAAMREDQAADCADEVARHVGVAPHAVAVAWAGEEADGGAVFEVRDGARMHTCHIDASGRVREIRHPGGEA